VKSRAKPNRKVNGQSKAKSAPAPAPEPEVVENPRTTKVLVLAALVVAVLVWSYSSSILYLVRRWWNEPDYLYGFLVPVFSGYLLWQRRSMIAAIKFRGSSWGLVLIALAAAMRFASPYYFLDLPDPVSMVPCLAGVILLIGGWPAMRWSWPAIVFLVFMFPVPGPIAGILSHPLQRIGTIASTFVIQTLGIPSVGRGNVIMLPETELGVAEACNGLSMMMLFFAVCFGAVFLSDRTWIEKLIILASAAPIAVLANVIRISMTAILYQLGGVDLGNRLFHELAGWFMMPLAVILLWIVLWFLDHALVTPPAKQPLFVKP
jgi:exosortase